MRARCVACAPESALIGLSAGASLRVRHSLRRGDGAQRLERPIHRQQNASVSTATRCASGSGVARLHSMSQPRLCLCRRSNLRGIDLRTAYLTIAIAK